MKAMMMTTAAVMLAATAVMASTTEQRIPTLKVGKCTITLLDSNGIKPLSGATLELKQAEDGKSAASAVANKSGLCEITVAEGRYILSINEKPITLVNAAKDGELAWARIVVGDSPMLVGGQEGATETVSYTLLGVKYTTWAAAVAAAAVAGVGINEIVKNNEGGSNGGGSSDPLAPSEQTANTPARPQPTSR